MADNWNKIIVHNGKQPKISDGVYGAIRVTDDRQYEGIPLLPRRFTEEGMGQFVARYDFKYVDEFGHIERCSIERRYQRDENYKWVISRGTANLGRDGLWYLEPSSSNRDDEYINLTRFDTVQDALDFIHEFCFQAKKEITWRMMDNKNNEPS